MGFFEIAAIILPVFGIIGAGYLARMAGVLSDSVGEGLSAYVFTIAVPCLLFRIMIDGTWPQTLPWGYWLAYFAGVAVVWPLAMLFVQRGLGRDQQTGIVAGFTAAQSNTVLVGIPLIVMVYGEAGGTPIAALISIHLPIMMFVAAVLMELARSDGANWSDMVRKTVGSILKHPIIIGILAGILWRSIGLPTDGLARPILDKLAATASPCALFALGLTLRRYGIAGDLRASVGITILKNLIHPVIVFVLATQVFDLSPIWVGAAVLFASCPCGVNAYLVANRYGTGLRISSSAIAISTAIAVVTCGICLTVIPLN